MKRSELLHYGILLCFAIVAYWPLASFHHTLRWDAVEQCYPWRYFMSDCLGNGIWPLWNPYPGGGYPFYADPQGVAWYPVSWIVCSISPYTLQAFAVEFIMTIVIASIGMYRLVKTFSVIPVAALIAGISYAACGFFIGNAEHFTWLVSAAWLPWVLWAYHKTTQDRKYGYGLLCALFLFLMLSGGYPAFITITLYMIILFFLIVILRRMDAVDKQKLLYLHIVMAMVFLLLSGVILLSWYQAYPFITRGTGVTLEKVNANPFSPRCLRSLLLPFATLKNEEYYGTDISMRNVYMGLCILIFVPIGLLRLKGRKNILVVFLSLFCLAAAMGPFLPIRSFLYRFVPLMGMFRFPAMFRIFFIVGIIIIAAQAISAVQHNARDRKKCLWVASCILGITIILLVRSVMKDQFVWGWGNSFAQFKEHLEASTHAEHVQLQCMVQVGLLIVFLSMGLMRNGRFFSSNVLVAFCAIDLILASALNAFGTVVDRAPLGAVAAPIKQLPHGFPVPDNTVAISANNDNSRRMVLLRTNTSVYYRAPAADGYNAFTLNSYNKLSESVIYDSVSANPYLYFADGIDAGADTDLFRNRRNVRVDAATYTMLQGKRMFTTNKQDTIIVKQFEPGSIRADVSAKDTAMIVIQQSYFDGWKVMVDGQAAPIIIGNFALMSTIVPSGKHQVVWNFEPKHIKLMAIISAVSFILLVAGMCLYRQRLF